MTKFADGDRVRATKDNNVLEGTLRYWEEKIDGGWFDLVFPDSTEFAQLDKANWTLELIKPSAQDVLRDMKIGTRFTYDVPDGTYYWIKVATNGYVYVSQSGTVSEAIGSNGFGTRTGMTVLAN